MKIENPTFYSTVLRSPQWKLWVRYNETDTRWDVHESMECGWLSANHFQEFLTFCRDAKIVELCNSKPGKQ